MKKKLLFTIAAFASVIIAFGQAMNQVVGDKDLLSPKSRAYIIGVVGIGLFSLFFWVLSKRNWKILRDTGTGSDEAPFSLSRTQMAWWTFIVLASLLFLWWKIDGLINITDQLLVLLGISAGTTVTANFIDNKDITDVNVKERHQSSSSSKNIFMNIISDQGGPSIHRFQNVLFSLAIGVFILYVVFTKNEVPELPPNLMVLMGISSSTYLAIKNGENKTYTSEVAQGELPPPPEQKK